MHSLWLLDLHAMQSPLVGESIDRLCILAPKEKKPRVPPAPKAKSPAKKTKPKKEKAETKKPKKGDYILSFH